MQVVDTGGPYYWSFAPSGESAIVHSGRDDSGNPASLIKILDLSNIEPNSFSLDLDGASFQAPTWSQNGEKILTAIRLSGGHSEIVLLDAEANLVKTITGVNAAVAFGLSPDGSKIALIEKSLPASPLFYGLLRMFDADSGEEIYASLEGNVFAFFWSPDSAKLAIYTYQLTPSDDFEAASSTHRLVSQAIQPEDSIKISVEVYYLTSEKTRTIMRQMVPSEGMMRIMYFFDQYQQSDTFWSPDSRWLLVMGTPIGGEGGIWVLDSTGEQVARYLAQGTLAFWSWR